MAEGIAQYLLQKKGLLEWQACSAGVFAADGADTSQLAIKALSNRGIQFEGSSKSLNTKMIMAAQAVYCMTPSHLQSALSLAPAASHIELLDSTEPILDPIGQSQEVYDAVASRLEQLIKDKITLLLSATKEKD